MEVGSGDYAVVAAANAEIRRGPSADCMSSRVNGSNYPGASGRKNVGLLSGSSGGVGGVVDVVDAGATASACCRCCCRYRIL